MPRAGKQCRERWNNHLDPSLNYEDWLQCEEDLIFELAILHKNKWAKIAKLLHGRSENSIKNYFYSTVRKNIRRVNKMLVFRESITGSIGELMKFPILHGLIFCNSRRCKVVAEQYKRNGELADGINLTGLFYEIKNEPNYSLRFSQEILSNFIISQEVLNNQIIFDNAWMQYWNFCKNFVSNHISD